ncbi:GMC family oxidoreductase N-terminal domain-containing protein [Catellatospora sp. KI3]|uniref:GMC family oxidoreductase n=1 Tax=Catellatospora sp. KI3 TaxID=3041620 RepID=UPI0024821A2C|nr:GMC family oxidoreductase N-terminal domain-containing protein [Catellatospora sp. KI3]MDI1463600.1 GMC family oxidoreductase N-terminal domain-containing protein [Catellatospora sp. KI3]
MYDYVIVGAGTAGSVLAARLSEDPGITVCVVEAGPVDDAQNIHIPAAFGTLFRSRVDWDYDSHEEPMLHRRRIYLPRGKTLGGSSSINAGLYLRGNPADFDLWGQPGWTFDELLPYFKRSEDNERGESKYHGVGGPMSVSDGRSNNVMGTAFVDAALEAGHSFNADFNDGANQDGFGPFQMMQRDGRRWSSADAYLRPALSRPNVTLETNLQIHRIVIENGRAVGVTGYRLDEQITLRANREVILSSGSYNTPFLLMHSGIGPAKVLSDVDIPVLLDHPDVGQNLKDQPIVPMVYPHDVPVSTLIGHEPQYVKEFLEHGTGPLTSNGPESGGYLRTRSGLDAPDVVFYNGPLMFADSGLGLPTGHGITFGPVVLMAESTGDVSLDSDDPTTKPKIVHNYFTNEDDLRSAVGGVQAGMEIARQKSLRPYTGTMLRGPASDSDKDVLEYVRLHAHSIFHATSTCMIGKVVDAELRVKGIDGLRVVDASIMPRTGRGAPNATVLAIGEKAADLILGRPAPRPLVAAAAKE